MSPWCMAALSPSEPPVVKCLIFCFLLLPPADAASATWSWITSQQASTTWSPPPSCPSRRAPSSWTSSARHPWRSPSSSEARRDLSLDTKDKTCEKLECSWHQREFLQWGTVEEPWSEKWTWRTCLRVSRAFSHKSNSQLLMSRDGEPSIILQLSKN